MHVPFDFRLLHRLAGLPFGVTPRTTGVEVAEGRLTVRFGPWRLTTELSNVTGCEVTGPYSALKTAGPAHLSLSDRGLTCATNTERGLCVRFATPVRGIDPFGLIRHPGVTLTVADVDALRRAIESGRAAPTPAPGPAAAATATATNGRR